MKNLDWVVIFRLKDFIKYFSNNELIQLSLGCRTFRKCLSPAIFTNFDFTYFAILENYKSSVITIDKINFSFSISTSNPFKPLNSDLSESRAQFKLDLSLIPNIPIKLVLHNAEYYYYLLYDIPNVFTKLTAIVITHSSIQYELLQYLLNNIDCLENLELSNSNLLHCAQNPDISPINWPNSLKKLKICDNWIATIEDRQSDILLANNYVFNSTAEQLYFYLKCLPKLKLFEYRLFLTSNNDNLLKFIKLNPQITNLTISIQDLNFGVFEAIQYIDELSSLQLKFSTASALEVNYNKLPILNNINCLTIDFYEIIDFGNILNSKFPNLTELATEILCNEFDKSISQIEKAPNIKNLILKINIESCNDIEFIFPKMDNLISLEFISDSDFDLYSFYWNVDSCPNLKSVKLSGFNQYDCNDKLRVNPELENGWEIEYFPHRIIYYRAS